MYHTLNNIKLEGSGLLFECIAGLTLGFLEYNNVKIIIYETKYLLSKFGITWGKKPNSQIV